MGGSAHTADAYEKRSADYIELFGDIASSSIQDRDRIVRWASGRPTRILDAGCGPGHWTAHLAALGCDVIGVDITPAFISHAKVRYPDLRFEVADITQLGFASRSFGGILAWFSLIHLTPAELDSTLSEFARILEDEGELIIGSFWGAESTTFEHKVTTAHVWSSRYLEGMLNTAGFKVLDSWKTTPPDARATVVTIARRSRRAHASQAPAPAG